MRNNTTLYFSIGAMKVYETIGINGIKLLRLFNYHVGSIRDYKTRQNGENHCRAQDLKRLIREEDDDLF